MLERWQDLRAGLDRWALSIVVVAGLSALVIGAKFGSVRPYEAKLLALAAPALPLAVVCFSSMGLRVRFLVPIALVALATATVAELAVVQALVPPRALVDTELSGASSTTMARLPAQDTPFGIEVHAALNPGTGNARGTYEIELERAGTVEHLSGEVFRSVQRSRRVRRMGPPTTTSVHETDTFRRSLPGAGDVAVRLTKLTGDIASHVRVEFRLAPIGESFSPRALIVLVVLAFAVDMLARSAEIHSWLFPAVAFVAVFAHETARNLNPDDPFATVIGVGLLAAIAGLIAWAIGRLAGWLVSPRHAGGGLDP